MSYGFNVICKSTVALVISVEDRLFLIYYE